MESERKEYAIYAITKHGVDIARKLKDVMKEADLYVAKKFLHLASEGSLELPLPMGPTLKNTFTQYNCHIHIISVGAVVRMIVPYIVNKKTDPAIVCVDDQAKFSICVLSGHVGRGNEYTLTVANALANTPVITTASDVGETLTVDILGRELGWTLEDNDRNVTRGCAAVVNQERVAIVQETGEECFWPMEKKLPQGVSHHRSFDQLEPEHYDMFLIVSDRTNIQKKYPHHWEKGIVYYPRSLVLGVGCDKDTPVEIVEAGILKFLSEENLSLKSVHSLATVDLKKEEPAFLEISKKYQWPLVTFPADILDSVPGIENPSETVKKYVGTRSVSEAACLLAASSKKLLMPKRKFCFDEKGKNMTMAIARLEFERRS